jgi:3D (Asp-Asp-Asp) domain-containing protein
MHKTSTIPSPAPIVALLQRTAAQALALTLVIVSLGATTAAFKPAASVVEPRVTTQAISPVAARELLHDAAVALQPESAERARTTRDDHAASASPAAGQVLKTLARFMPRPAIANAPRVRTIEMEVTAYCPCAKCCGSHAQGITASGKPVTYNGGLFVAADRVHKFGTKLIVPGYAGGAPVEVIDRGGAIKGNKLDVYFPTHAEALKWGRQKKVSVTVFE